MSTPSDPGQSDEVGPDPLEDDTTTTTPPSERSSHNDPQGRRQREVEETLAGAGDSLEDTLVAPPAQTPLGEDLAGPSRFLDQLRKQTPFWDLAERVARTSYPGRTLEVRMAQLRQDRPAFVWFCLVGDWLVRAIIVTVLITLGTAAAVKTLSPIPWPW